MLKNLILVWNQTILNSCYLGVQTDYETLDLGHNHKRPPTPPTQEQDTQTPKNKWCGTSLCSCFVYYETCFHRTGLELQCWLHFIQTSKVPFSVTVRRLVPRRFYHDKQRQCFYVTLIKFRHIWHKQWWHGSDWEKITDIWTPVS